MDDKIMEIAQRIRGMREDLDISAAHTQLAAVSALGIDLEQVGHDLQVAGLAQFETAYADLLKLV